jgi:hypothetical protein
MVEKGSKSGKMRKKVKKWSKSGKMRKMEKFRFLRVYVSFLNVLMFLLFFCSFSGGVRCGFVLCRGLVSACYPRGQTGLRFFFVFYEVSSLHHGVAAKIFEY